MSDLKSSFLKLMTDYMNIEPVESNSSMSSGLVILDFKQAQCSFNLPRFRSE